MRGHPNSVERRIRLWILLQERTRATQQLAPGGGTKRSV